MKKSFLICLLLIGLLGCDGVTIIDYFHRQPVYINNSGVTVNLIAGEYEHELNNNDTLCNRYLYDNTGSGSTESCSTENWFVPYAKSNEKFIPDAETKSAIYFKMEFLNEPKTCLVFNGDKKIGNNDIRYWENYTLVKQYSDIRMLSYTITSEHLQQAKEEYCE